MTEIGEKLKITIATVLDTHQAGVYLSFGGMKRIEVSLHPLDSVLVHRKVTPSIKFAGTHLYTWVKRGTVRVKCIAQEHNTMSSTTDRTQTSRSGDERTNHECLQKTKLTLP